MSAVLLLALRMPLRTFVGREAIVRAREDPRLVCHVRTLRRAALWHIVWASEVRYT